MISSIIIDDDSDTTAVFSEYLELSQIKVAGVGKNGKEAVDLYVKLRPDVVFLDVMMPDYDGFYGLKKIKQLDPTATVIMVTADLTQKTNDTLEELGANGIIYKPFDIQQILEIIKDLQSRKVVSTIER